LRHRRKGNDRDFTLIDNKDGKEIYSCPYQPSKNPAHGPW
jgi:hypothetical protein